MTKLLNTTIAATLALGIAAAATIQPAEAGSQGKYIALGVAAGILGTVAVSKARKRNRRAVRSSSRCVAPGREAGVPLWPPVSKATLCGGLRRR